MCEDNFQYGFLQDESKCPIKFLSPYERYKLVKPFIQAEEEKEAAEKAKENNQIDDKSTDDRIASVSLDN